MAKPCACPKNTASPDTKSAFAAKEWLDDLTPFDDDFIAAVEALQQEQREHPQERDFGDTSK